MLYLIYIQQIVIVSAFLSLGPLIEYSKVWRLCLGNDIAFCICTHNFVQGRGLVQSRKNSSGRGQDHTFSTRFLHLCLITAVYLEKWVVRQRRFCIHQLISKKALHEKGETHLLSAIMYKTVGESSDRRASLLLRVNWVISGYCDNSLRWVRDRCDTQSIPCSLGS